MAKLSTEKRKQLPDSAFGIPEKRMYPLYKLDENDNLVPDKAHIESAVKLFGHASDADKPKLARNILKAAHEADMDTSGWDKVNAWAKKESPKKKESTRTTVTESTTSFDSVMAMTDLILEYNEILYDEFYDAVYSNDETFMEQFEEPDEVQEAVPGLWEDFLTQHAGYDSKTHTYIDPKTQKRVQAPFARGTSKEMNRRNAFLKRHNFNPENGTIEIDEIDPSTGQKMRVPVEFIMGSRKLGDIRNSRMSMDPTDGVPYDFVSAKMRLGGTDLMKRRDLTEPWFGHETAHAHQANAIRRQLRTQPHHRQLDDLLAARQRAKESGDYARMYEYDQKVYEYIQAHRTALEKEGKHFTLGGWDAIDKLLADDPRYKRATENTKKHNADLSTHDVLPWELHADDYGGRLSSKHTRGKNKMVDALQANADPLRNDMIHSARKTLANKGIDASAVSDETIERTVVDKPKSHGVRTQIARENVAADAAKEMQDQKYRRKLAKETLQTQVASGKLTPQQELKAKKKIAAIDAHDKKTSTTQEGAVMISQESFVQEDVDIGALASAGLAAWKGSKQLKAESMDISMFKRLPMTRENLEKYSSGHGTFVQDPGNYHLTHLDDGVILVDEHDIVAGLVIVRRTFDDKVWITRLTRSLEWKNDGIILQLAKLAVDEFDAEFAAIDQNNTYVSKLLLSHGWKLLEQDSGMCLMKYVGDEEDEASEYTATDEDKNTFDEIMSEYMLEWGSSGKLFYHLSDQRSLDGQVFKPRVPAYIEPYNPHETGFENSTTPRVCFSSTIEGALNAITVNVQRTNPVTFRDMYVYIPEKPINEYKHKTNKELIRDHDVYDANVTKEMWILEPVRLKLYGVIHVDQARSVKRKSTVKTVDGKRDTRNYFTYKWHWLVKPKVLDSNPFHYDTMAVCRRLADEVNHFKYGLVKNGKLDTNPKNDEWDKYWHLQSPEQFEQSGGGNCWDFVEWEAGYLDAYGIPCKKYYMSTVNQDGKLETHTFIVVPNNGKYIYIEAAFKRIADEIHNIKEFDSLHAIFKYVAECMFEHNNCSVMNYGVFDYTDNTPKPGTDSQQYMNWITSKCKVVYDGSIDRKTKKRSESK